ncbi:MAG: ABC transporter permease [Anaerolineae bacterium]
MIGYFARRLAYMVALLVVLSVVAFAIIQLPPGDYLTSYVTLLKAQGQAVDQALIDALRRQYGLDQPMAKQYWMWVNGFIRGDFGYSFQWNRPVKELIWDRLGYSVAISLIAIFFTYAVAIPIGIYSATRQYSLFDYAFTVLAFLGMTLPAFLVALVFMFLAYRYFGLSPGGLFSPEYLDKPWSLAKLGDMLSHLPVPIVIIALAGTGGTVRVLRALVLDELRRPYVITARAKGLPERRLLYKYPVRIALNPLASTMVWLLPGIVSGEIIVSIVLNLPTTGPLLLNALLAQDMYLAGSVVMFLGLLTLVGMLVSDLVLAWLDPRIRYE